MTKMLERLKILILILLGCAALVACPSPPPPPAVIAVLQVSPAAVLLQPGGASQTLSVVGYAADGSKLEVSDIEWLNSDPAQVQITPNSSNPNSATIQASGTIGTAVITARIRSQPTIFSDPVVVSTAKLKPGVETINDDQVVFPFVNIPSHLDLKTIQPSDTTFGSETMIGGFSEKEIAALFENTNGLLKYGVVLRGSPPANGKLLVSSGGATISGRVIKSQVRGAFALVQFELPTLPEIFEDYSFKIDSAKLEQQKTLRRFQGQVRLNSLGKVSRQSGGSDNEGLWDCTVSAGVQFVGSGNPPFTLGISPIWDGILEMKAGVVQKFYFKAGIKLDLLVNPEVRFQPGVFAGLKCKPAKVWERRFPLAGMLSAFLEPGLKFYPSLEISGNLQAGSAYRAGFKLDFSRSYWTGGTYTPTEGWKPLCSDWKDCSASSNDKNIYLEKSTFSDPVTIDFKMGAYYNAVAGFQIGGELIGTLKDWFGELPLIGEKITSIADNLYIDLLTAKAGPETRTIWSNTDWVLFNEKNQSGANTYVAATITATYPRLKTLILKLFGIPFPETPPPPLLALPQLNILEPYRNLVAESITSPSNNPMKVKAGQSLDVRATIGRNVQWLQPITDLIALPIDVHTTWPHRAELWLKTGDSAVGGNISHTKIADLTVQNDRILTGSFTVTTEMCQKAAIAITKTVTLKLIAYNYMYKVVESPNFVGDFKISCSDLSVTPNPVKLRAKVKEKAMGSFTIANNGSQDVNYTATGGGIVAIRSGASGKVVATQHSAVGLIATCPDTAGTYGGNIALGFKEPNGTQISEAPSSVAVSLECWKEPDPDPLKPKKPKTGGSHGDPHLITLDGRYYDFQGVGDYILSKSTTDDFEVQARFIPYGTTVSVNDAVAVRSGGDVVEVYSSPSGQAEIYLNQQKQTSNTFSQQLPGGTLVVAEAGKISIAHPDGSVLSASIGSFLYSLVLYTVAERNGNFEGLLGNGDDDPTNDLRIRNGAVLTNPTTKDLYLEYRTSWRVPLYSAGSLFSHPPERWDFLFPANVVSLADLDPAKRAAAEQICLSRGIVTPSVFDGCVYDVAISNDPKFADYAFGVDPNKLGVILNPQISFVRFGQQKTFGAFITGTDSSNLSWSTSCGHLSVNDNIGVFTAPNTEQECQIKATLSSDGSIVGSAKVLVGDLNGVYWDGGGDKTRWDDPKNWLEDKLPAADSDVVVVSLGSELKLQVGSNPTVHSLRTTGNVTLTTGTINAAGGLITGGFRLEGGNLNSSGALTLSGQTTWASGALSGTGKFVNIGELTLASGFDHYLSGTLENAGTIKIAGNLWSSNLASVIKNTGTLELINDSGILEYIGRINLSNTGSVMKSGGIGISSLQLGTLTNTGTLEVQSGTLRVQDGTVIGGNYNAALNATLEFYGNITLKGTLGGAPLGAVQWANATINVDASEQLHLKFTGTGLQFLSGTLVGPGSIVNDAGSTWILNGGFDHYLSGTLENAGTIKIAGNLWSSNAASAPTIKNTGTLELTGDSGILAYSGRIDLENSGSVVKTGGTGISSLQLGTLTNTGTLEAQTGTLRVQNGTVVGGTYNALLGATLEFYGDITLKGTLTGVPVGTVQMVGSILVMNGEELHLKFSGTGLQFLNSTLVGPGKIINDARNSLTLAAGFDHYLSGTLENAGTLLIAGNLWSSNLAGARTIKNTGTLEFTGDAGIFEYIGRISLSNTGSIIKSGGTGISSLQLGTLTNMGLLEAQSGTLRIQNGITIGGTYNALLGATLEFYDSGLQGTLTGAPAGKIQMVGNVLVAASNEAHLHFTATGISFLNGTVVGPGKLVNDLGSTLRFAAGFDHYLQGTVENIGTLLISGNLYRSSTTGSGLLTNTGTLEFTNDSGILEYIGRVTLNNSGTMLKSGGTGSSTITTIFSNTGTITEASGHFVFN